MNAQDMHIALLQGLQRVAANAYDYLTAEEIDFWLNRAQDRFVKDRAFITGDVRQIGFQGNQKRLDDIRSIVVQNYVDTWDMTTNPEWIQVDLPADYQHLVNIRANIRKSVCGNVTVTSPQAQVPVRVVDNAEVHFMQQNPFAKAQWNSPLATISENDISVYQDAESYILEGITADYIRIPERIDLALSQDCELAEHTHQEIVDIAVKNILEAIESPRYQTNSAEQLTSE